MKLVDIKNAEPALRKLANAELPIKLVFQISSVIDQIDPHLAKFEEFRVSLVKKYGVETENGIEVPKDKLGEFNDEINSLLNAEITVNILPIKLESILEAENMKFSVRDLKSLMILGLLIE